MAGKTGFYRIRIRKEALKFSAAHMTFFPDGSKEALHGHNYRTEVRIEMAESSLEAMLPFADVKNVMREICSEWDEKVLLPERCPFMKIVSRGESTEIVASGKRYVFPSDEVVFLPADNVTSESLARAFCERLTGAIPRADLERAGVRSIEAIVEEMTGQGASYVQSF
jgi:6-pyruvoyltetrahydropterin/6-carboxytetrahydropterin synthase